MFASSQKKMRDGKLFSGAGSNKDATGRTCKRSKGEKIGPAERKQAFKFGLVNQGESQLGTLKPAS